MPKRRKRGRPRTGTDPMIGVRIPARMLKKVEQIADALSVDRSTALRALIQAGLSENSFLLRRGKGRGVADRIVLATAAAERARGAEEAAERANPRASAGLEIKALHERERETELIQQIASPARHFENLALGQPQRARRSKNYEPET